MTDQPQPIVQGDHVPTFTQVPPSPWVPIGFDDTEDVLRSAVFQAIGSASVCWENPGGAGVFDSSMAKWVGDGIMAWMGEYSAEREKLIHQLAEAIRLTREYVDPASAVTEECLLPPIEGWSWYDAMVAYGKAYPSERQWWNESAVPSEWVLRSMHRADIDTDIDTGEYVAGCMCGWTSNPVESHTLAEQAFTGHFSEVQSS